MVDHNPEDFIFLRGRKDASDGRLERYETYSAASLKVYLEGYACGLAERLKSVILQIGELRSMPSLDVH